MRRAARDDNRPSLTDLRTGRRRDEDNELWQDVLGVVCLAVFLVGLLYLAAGAGG